ncbi:hypothetical protein FN846DRAFT_910186 [Sphaerosporella brunnea]|uniref:Uncharacterized protein n=1 Tax=Sphaerosporella brunnea TaxID=1250544 RepID=A0A5J5EPA0_9PEZI|nr:hypothetical protein FN846DRAFT_783026 [Sphaerosporella brunnea]KAA8898238.1 hypothetical protein FN846DRAFT_910186 [Sphaerosporella brunnea]
MSAVGAATADVGVRTWREAFRRDPELYGMAILVTGVLGTFGYYFGRNSTAVTARGAGQRINVARRGEPWAAKGVENTDKNSYKYMYHPRGDFRNAPKRAPGALNSVIVPGVTLPKEVHEKLNKYGKDNY